MKSLDEQDHYEVLEVTRAATAEEIEQAYRVAVSTYSGDSLATYSVFDPIDSHSIRERIELAYRVLSNNEARLEYDGALGLDTDSLDSLIDREVSVSMPPVQTRSIPVPPPFDDFEDGVEDEGEAFSGARLRRARMRRGIELEHIADITKVNVTHLKRIEEETFKDLPAEVYVRGFVSAYVKTIGLDPERVLPDFMQRFRETCGAKRKGYLHGSK